MEVKSVIVLMLSLIEFAWTLCVLTMCGGTISHRNIWNFSKCSILYNSVASEHIFFVSNALYGTNLLQVITECRSCSTSSPRPPSAHALHVRARILSAPSRPRPKTRPVCVPCMACAPSCPHPCLFSPAPVVVLVGAWRTSLDSHLRLPTATSTGNNKKS
jgi:hypothetical protein